MDTLYIENTILKVQLRRRSLLLLRAFLHKESNTIEKFLDSFGVLDPLRPQMIRY